MREGGDFRPLVIVYSVTRGFLRLRGEFELSSAR